MAVANRPEVADQGRHDRMPYMCTPTGEHGVCDRGGMLPSAVTALRFGPRTGAMLSMTMHPTSVYYEASAERREK